MKRKVNLGKLLHYPKASKKYARNKLILSLLSKPIKSNSERVNSSKFKCILNI